MRIGKVKISFFGLFGFARSIVEALIPDPDGEIRFTPDEAAEILKQGCAAAGIRTYIKV